MSDLIKRARELAKLREYTTSGPWQAVGNAVFGHGGLFVFSVYEADSWAADKNLIAAAPEMAELLAQMADKLEECMNQQKSHNALDSRETGNAEPD